MTRVVVTATWRVELPADIEPADFAEDILHPLDIVQRSQCDELGVDVLGAVSIVVREEI